MTLTLNPVCLNPLARLSLALVLAWMLAFLPGHAIANPRCEATSYVQTVGEAYDRASRSGSSSAFATAASRYTDLRSLSLFALGRYRKDLPKSREGEYLALTRSFIGAFMADNGKGFRASELVVVNCRQSGSTIVVDARLSTGGKVMFRLSKRGGGYRVQDVNMRGIWLAQQLRSTFVGTISRSGSIDGLFKYLKS